VHPGRALLWIPLCTSCALVAGCESNPCPLHPIYAPHATVSVLVLAHPSLDPIPGARCEMQSTGEIAMADSAGVARFAGLGSGVYQLMGSAAGFTPMILTFDLNQAAYGTDEVHQDEVLHLLERSAALELSIQTGLPPRPASGAVVTVRDWGLPADLQDHQLYEPGLPGAMVADSTGSIFLEGLPPVSIELRVEAYDADQDGVRDFDSELLAIDLVPGDTVRSTSHLELSYYQYPRYEETNIPRDTDYFLQHCTLLCEFSVDMDTRTDVTYVRLIDAAQYAVDLPIAVEWHGSRLLEVHPGQSLGDPTIHYQVEFNLLAANGAQFHDRRTFRWVTPADCPLSALAYRSR